MKAKIREKASHAVRGIGNWFSAVAAKAMCLAGCVAVALTCSAYDWDDGTYTWSYSGFSQATITGVSLTAGGEVVGNLTIPDTVGSSSIPVTIIGDGAFQDCKSITGVTIPYGVTLIGVSAFEGCEAMTSVDIPATATTIGDSAFQGCTSLGSVSLPAEMKAIATSLFRDCSSLTSIDIPDSVIVINGHAFDGCTKLEKVYFGSSPSLTLIDEYAFYGCEALYLFSPNYYVFEIPDGVSINAYAFSRCKSLTNIYLRDGIGTIGEGAFAECASLEYARLPCKNAEFVEGLEKGGVFAGCPEELNVIFREDVAGVEWSFRLEGGAAVLDNAGKSVIPNTTAGAVTIPSTLGGCPVTEIGEYAFYYCDSLTSVEIPEGVTSIGDEAFYECTSLTGVEIPEGVTEIGDEAFYDCTSLTSVEIPGSVKEIGANAFYDCDSLATVTIHEGVTSIGEFAFDDCDSLTTVEIPGSVTSIGKYAFYDCYSLATVTIPEGVTSIGGSAFAYCSSLAAVTIPEGVTSIGEYAFYNCDSLTTVEIPDGVKEIGANAFGDCDSLETVNIAEGVESIGKYAFEYCASLKTVNIPESVTSIGDGAFLRCDSLADADGFVIIRDVLYYYNGAETTVDIPAGVTAISDDAFYYNTSITTVTIPEGVTSIGDYAFYNCSSLTTVTIPEGVTSIGDYAFQDCSSLASVTIPESVTSIGDGAFSGCTGLAKGDFLIVQNILYKYTGPDTSVVIPDGVTKVDEVAFAGNNTMMSVTFPATVTSIGNGAFNDCTALESVTFPDALTSIGNAAFDGCTALESVKFPDALTSIGGSAFSYCEKLASVEFPDALTSIGDRAFYCCDALESVEIPQSVASIGEYAFAYCDKLEKVAVKSPGTAIGDYAFLNSSALADITLPAASNKLGKDAFWGTALTTVHVAPGQTDGVRDNIAATQDPPYDTSGITFIKDCDPVLAVTFESNFGSIPPETRYVYAGSAVGTLPALTHEGYTLIGWFTEDNAGVPVADTTVIDEKVKFYALWLQDGYERWIDTNGIAWIYRIVDGEAEIYNDEFAAIPYDTAGDIVVPDTLGGCPVTRIGDWAFESCKLATSFDIPESVESIGESAFDDCVALESIELPEGITVVEESTFYCCEALETVTLPSTLKTIGDSAFEGCTLLESIDIPEGVETIGECAFSECDSLDEVTIPDSVTEIGDDAFLGCDGLTDITVPGTVTTLGKSIFEDCSALATATLGDGIESVPEAMFAGCTSLEDAILPDSVTEIGYRAFANCEMLDLSMLPDAITDIWEYAFLNCEALHIMALPEGLKGVKAFAFTNCHGLQYIDVPGTATEISTHAFYNCTALEEVSLGEGVKNIDDEAFGGCKALATLWLPKSLEFIGSDAFVNCHLATVHVEHGDTARIKKLLKDSGFDTTNIEFIESPYVTWTDTKGVTWTYKVVDDAVVIEGKDGEPAIPATTVGKVTVPAEIDGKPVTAIGNRAFFGCEGITEIDIPDTVTTIGRSAFRGCDGLADDDGFVIFDGVLYHYAGADAAVVVPDGVTTIAYHAFGSNTLIQSVILPEGLAKIEDGAFYKAKNLVNATVPESLEEIGKDAFAQTALAVVNVPAGMTDAVKAMLTASGLDTTGVDFYEAEEPGFTVTFDAKGGTVTPGFLVLEPGQAVGELPVPTRTGYDFVGWLTAGGTAVTPATVINGDVTFYADWKEKVGLFWFTTKAAAMADAKETGRMVFMLCGRDTCMNTMNTKNKSCANELVAEELQRKCTLWYSNCDTQPEENYIYTDDMTGTIALPIICIIDPANPDKFIKRSTGYKTAAEILEMLADVQEPTKTFCTVTFDAMGGTGGTTRKVVVGEAVGTLPATTREGYFLVGWFTEEGTKVSAATKVMGDVTFYAKWIAKDDPAAFWYDRLEASDIVDAYAVLKNAKVYGAVFDGNDVVGIVELKLGKVNLKKNTSKITGSVTTLDGKKHTAKGVPPAGVSGVTGKDPITVTLDVKGLGQMTLKIGGDKFAGSLGDYHVQTADVGGPWTAAATVAVDADDFSMFPGALTDFAPLTATPEPFAATGMKWAFNKAAKLKWAKPKAGGEKPGVEVIGFDPAIGKGLIVDTTKGCTNYSSIKLTYAAKKGTFKGAFKLYALQGEGTKVKLKKYSIKVTGLFVGGRGFGEAISKKPYAVWPVIVK